MSADCIQDQTQSKFSAKIIPKNNNLTNSETDVSDIDGDDIFVEALESMDHFTRGDISQPLDFNIPREPIGEFQDDDLFYNFTCAHSQSSLNDSIHDSAVSLNSVSQDEISANFPQNEIANVKNEIISNQTGVIIDVNSLEFIDRMSKNITESIVVTKQKKTVSFNVNISIGETWNSKDYGM